MCVYTYINARVCGCKVFSTFCKSVCGALAKIESIIDDVSLIGVLLMGMSVAPVSS